MIKDKPQFKGSDIAQTSIRFPVRLGCDIQSFSLSDDIVVAKMSEQAKTDLLRIENPKYDNEGRLSCFMPLPGCPASVATSSIFTEDINNGHEYCSSNYVVHVQSRERAEHLNIALKLIETSRTALYLGYENDTVHILSPPKYYGVRPLTITEANIKEIAKVLDQVTSAKEDAKLQLMADKYLNAVSSSHIRSENRFLELAIILEMLLLPAKQQEVAYRFSLRMAKVCAKYFNDSTHDRFRLANEIYKIRSGLVHSGKDLRVSNNLPHLLDITRRLLLVYISTPNVFGDKELDELCLA